MLKAPDLQAKLQEAMFKEAFVRLDGEACVKGRPSWDNKAAKLAGLLLYFLSEEHFRAPFERASTGGFSKDLFLRMRQPDAPATAPTLAAPENESAASEADATPPEPAEEDVPAAPAAPAAPQAASSEAARAPTPASNRGDRAGWADGAE